jgi:hypothetical protein
VELAEEPGTFRPVPVFNKPGSVRLTLYDGEQSLGTRTVTVITCPSEAREAVELLRPRLGQKYRGQRDELLWSQVVSDRALSRTTRLTNREMQLLRDQLPIMKRHPDWADIVEISLALVESNHFIQSLIEDRADGQSRLRDDVENPELPRFVTDCMKGKTQNPFVQAIQDDIGTTSSMLTYLIRDRERDRAARLSP